jgi:hypothetical protein
MFARICPTFAGMFISDTGVFVDKLIRTLDTESYMSGSVSDPTRQLLRTSVTHGETTSNKVVPASSNESRREVSHEDICLLCVLRNCN